jgi:hypothetical protein
LNYYERVRSAKTKREFDQILREAVEEGDREAATFLAEIGGEPAVLEDLEVPVLEEPLGVVAALIAEENAMNNRLLHQAMQAHEALARATGKPLAEIAVPAIAWDPKLSKSQIEKRKRGTT